MKKRRLLKLADLLKADAKNKKGIKFDMKTFGDVGDATNPLSCSTSACAMGLAAISGAFKREGLGARIQYKSLYFIWNGKSTRDGFTVARELFDIDRYAANTLFGISNEVGASGERAVAKRIRDFVAGKAAP